MRQRLEALQRVFFHAASHADTPDDTRHYAISFH